jgi:hypothetical protein
MVFAMPSLTASEWLGFSFGAACSWVLLILKIAFVCVTIAQESG